MSVITSDPVSSRARRCPRRAPPKVIVEIGAGRAVHDARGEVHTRGSVHGDDRHFQIGYPVEERRHRRARSARRAGAEQRVDGQPDVGPRPIHGDLTNAFGQRERRDALVERASRARRGRDPDGHTETMKRARGDPAVAAVVAGTGRDEHAIAKAGRVSLCQYGGDGAARGFHQRGQVDPGCCGLLIPGGGLLGRKDGDQTICSSARSLDRMRSRRCRFGD